VDVPYLSSQRGVSCPRELDPSRVHIGLTWKAGDWASQRSIDPCLFAALASVQGVRVHLLQPAERSERFPLNVDDFSSAAIVDAAATISQLDLVLTVDTMMAHLAGATGVPVWTMLCHDCDWRWGMGTTTPWYPTMRLFRQPAPGDWAGVIDQVRGSLALLVR